MRRSEKDGEEIGGRRKGGGGGGACLGVSFPHMQMKALAGDNEAIIY